MASRLIQRKNKTVETNLFDFNTNTIVPSENPPENPEIVNPEQQKALSQIENLDFKLSQYFNNKFIVQRSLTRQLVSFQANKTIASYRWYKYKEAFSAPLVGYLLSYMEKSIMPQDKPNHQHLTSGKSLVTTCHL